MARSPFVGQLRLGAENRWVTGVGMRLGRLLPRSDRRDWRPPANCRPPGRRSRGLAAWVGFVVGAPKRFTSAVRNCRDRLRGDATVRGEFRGTAPLNIEQPEHLAPANGQRPHGQTNCMADVDLGLGIGARPRPVHGTKLLGGSLAPSLASVGIGGDVSQGGPQIWSDRAIWPLPLPKLPQDADEGFRDEVLRISALSAELRSSAQCDVDMFHIQHTLRLDVTRPNPCEQGLFIVELGARQH